MRKIRSKLGVGKLFPPSHVLPILSQHTESLLSWLCLCVCFQIERTLFEDTVKTLNNYYAEAEKIGGQSYLEGCLACATAYLIFLCMETRYEKVCMVISNTTHSNINERQCHVFVTFFLCCSVHVSGVEEDSQVHSGAEWEDLCSQRSAHHRSHRERNACRILTLCFWVQINVCAFIFSV